MSFIFGLGLGLFQKIRLLASDRYGNCDLVGVSWATPKFGLVNINKGPLERVLTGFARDLVRFMC